jgi:hypothetical protein
MCFFRNRLKRIRCPDPHVQEIRCGSALYSSSVLQKIYHYAMVYQTLS